MNSVNYIYILRKKLGQRSPHPDYFLAIEITFTYIYLYTEFSTGVHVGLSNLLSLSLSLCSLLHHALTVFFVELDVFTCQKMFQLLPGYFLHPVWFHILSRQCNINFAFSECPIIVFSHCSFQENSNSFLTLLLLCFRTF